MKQAADQRRGLLWSGVSTCVGGWIAIECAGALLDLIRDGFFYFPATLVKGPSGLDPWLLSYAARPALTVVMATVLAIFGLLGICATVFGVTDLWKALAASEET